MRLKQLQRSIFCLGQNAFLFPLNVSRLAFRYEIQRTFLWLVNSPRQIAIYLLLGIEKVTILVSPCIPESSIDFWYLARKRRTSYE